MSSDEGKSLIKDLDSNKKWVGVTTNPKSRRVIHYGYTYPYTGGPLQKTDSIPQTYNEMLSKFQKTEPMEKIKQPFDQLIINEYLTGQGISAHTDHTAKFGPIIACVTLGSGVEIEFTKGGGSKPLEKQSVYVQSNSLYVMSGDSRSIWKHGIPQRKSDIVNGSTVVRGKRVSLTFRQAQV